MDSIKVASNLYLIPLDQKLPGFTFFISAWLYRGEKNFLIDVGPASTIPVLLDALEALDVRQLDAIFLTHIHIDHAGGIGDLVSRFPNTRVICHGSGIPHLIDPSRLWQGSVKTLGDIALAYGQIQPVPPDLLHDASKLVQVSDVGSSQRLEPTRSRAEVVGSSLRLEPTKRLDETAGKIISYLTPGHAPHHVSYKLGDYLFAGEAGGVFINFDEVRSTASDVGSNLRLEPTSYLRPATPPKFFMETSIQSLDTLINIPHTLLCYGHFGATKNTPSLLEAHKNQLFLWKDIIREQLLVQVSDLNQHYEGSDILEPCLDVLLEKDPLLGGWKHLEPDVQKRERGFLYNSIRGFAGYLKPLWF